ncbi:site-specific integrase [Kitasatospora sp. NBC_00240]|uniref:tyrosine-type recombinase/integrase n=1 Tax=Kitasatospora sp. NBC_00240 TaxID=2903567 RepID=UPI0022597550|nr:site-specific integrase [Kitasatospora sp. NBC_00240]MCX5215665.1 site-specific integrase [Kitasatospora sp. NBC_00240]
MILEEGPKRDLRQLVLPQIGKLVATDDPWDPWQILDPQGQPLGPVALYFADLLAGGSPATTLRSYGMDLLRWWRFLWVLGVEWDRATQRDARDFALWMRMADKPVRPHWRNGSEPDTRPAAGKVLPGAPNPVTGKLTIGPKYAPTTRAHCETVLRQFYDFHLDQRTGALLVNPFPLVRGRRERRNASHKPTEPFQPERKGRYRPKVPKRIPRRIPDEKYTEIFARIRHNRDRALLEAWASSGARASELLGAQQQHAKPGQQVIGVIRKGTEDFQELPASPAAFVWLRLYQEEVWRRGAGRGRAEPLWVTLRRPFRPLTYDAARIMFTRVNQLLGSNWTLHDLRHTASFRMANDPEMSLHHVQLILGHKHLSTTETYLNPSADELIEHGLAHLTRMARKQNAPQPAPPAPGYNPDSLNTLFGVIDG